MEKCLRTCKLHIKSHFFSFHCLSIQAENIFKFSIRISDEIKPKSKKISSQHNLRANTLQNCYNNPFRTASSSQKSNFGLIFGPRRIPKIDQQFKKRRFGDSRPPGPARLHPDGEGATAGYTRLKSGRPVTGPGVTFVLTRHDPKGSAD